MGRQARAFTAKYLAAGSDAARLQLSFAYMDKKLRHTTYRTEYQDRLERVDATTFTALGNEGGAAHRAAATLLALPLRQLNVLGWRERAMVQDINRAPTAACVAAAICNFLDWELTSINAPAMEAARLTDRMAQPLVMLLQHRDVAEQALATYLAPAALRERIRTRRLRDARDYVPPYGTGFLKPFLFAPESDI